MQLKHEAKRELVLSTILFLVILVAGILACGRTWSDDATPVRDVANLLREMTRIRPNHPIQKSNDYAGQLAAAVLWSAEYRSVPAPLLLSVLYHESSFIRGRVGKIGEVGLGQLHGVASDGCDFTTLEGDVDCAARWLGRGYARCKTPDGALFWYAGHIDCGSSKLALVELVDRRLRTMKKIETWLETNNKKGE
jgi:hypothetical protein